MNKTTIEWTDYTFNPWSGCAKVSEGCKNCYAEVNYSVKMRGVKWGPQGNRVVAAESMWKQPIAWDRKVSCNVAHGGKRPRVFCASLADVFEDWQGPMMASGNVYLGKDFRASRGESDRLTMQDVRARLFALIDATPNLDWLVLTKRPENIAAMMPPYAYHACVTGDCPHESVNDCNSLAEQQYRDNLWLGVSVENQKAADERIPLLLQTPAAVRFLSCEPLLGPVNLRRHFAHSIHCEHAHPGGAACSCPRIGWCIVGGESGSHSRQCRPEWIRSIVEQCKAANVHCFVKQMGGNIVTRNDMIEDVFNNGESGWPDPNVEHNINGFREEYQGADCRIRLVDKKGGDMAEWPEDLRVREFPK